MSIQDKSGGSDYLWASLEMKNKKYTKKIELRSDKSSTEKRCVAFESFHQIVNGSQPPKLGRLEKNRYTFIKVKSDKGKEYYVKINKAILANVFRINKEEIADKPVDELTKIIRNKLVKSPPSENLVEKDSKQLPLGPISEDSLPPDQVKSEETIALGIKEEELNSVKDSKQPPIGHISEDSLPPDQINSQDMKHFAIALGIKEEELNREMEKNQDGFEKFIDNKFTELSENLLVDKQILIDKYDEGRGIKELTRYLQKKQNKWGPNGTFSEVMDKARQEYKQIKGELSPGILTRQQVMKAYRLSLRELHKNNSAFADAGVAFGFKKNKNMQFLAQIDKGKLHIVKWSGRIDTSEDVDEGKHPDHLGKGSFGVAQKVYNVAINEFAALKIAHSRSPDLQEKAKKDILNEAIKLNMLNSVEGVQKEFRCVFNLTANLDKGDKKIVGVLGPLYWGDGIDVIVAEKAGAPILSAKMKLELALQLLNGLKAIHQKMIHGDIKADNIFASFNKETNKWELMIGDLGDVKLKEGEFDLSNKELPNRGEGVGTIATPGYLSEMDMIEGSIIVKKYDKSNNRKQKELLQKQWVQLHEKRDIFALSTSLYMLFFSEFPYQVGGDDDLTPTVTKYDIIRIRENLNDLFSNNKKLTEIMMRALAENPSDRPTLQELIDVFDKAYSVL